MNADCSNQSGVPVFFGLVKVLNFVINARSGPENERGCRRRLSTIDVSKRSNSKYSSFCTASRRCNCRYVPIVSTQSTGKTERFYTVPPIMKNRRNSDEINDDADENGSFTPPFLPLEESNPVSAMSLSSSLAAANTTTGTSTSSTTGNVSTKHNLNQRTKAHSSYNKASPSLTRSMSNRGGIVSSCNGKKVVSIVMLSLLALVIWDAVLTPPERRWIKPDFSETFLLWVQDHPIRGLLAFLVVIAVAVVFMVPIGTPLTLGCGYVYKGAYGWKLGLTIATAVSMAGSALGAVVCFLLGRYLMRDQVRTWIRKYPLFDAIDAGTSRCDISVCFFSVSCIVMTPSTCLLVHTQPGASPPFFCSQPLPNTASGSWPCFT